MSMLHKALNETYNLSHTLCRNLTDSITALFGRDYFDLSDLNTHNLMEHDASLIRESSDHVLILRLDAELAPCAGHDAIFEPNQALPARDLIATFLASATGPASKEHPKGQLTTADLSRCLTIRRAESKSENPTFRLESLHKSFSSSNSSLLYEVWGKGDVASLRKTLFDERLHKGFEPG